MKSGPWDFPVIYYFFQMPVWDKFYRLVTVRILIDFHVAKYCALQISANLIVSQLHTEDLLIPI